MKSVSKRLIPLMAGLLAVVALGAGAPALSTASAQQAEARVRVLHASPDAPAVDVYVDGTEAIGDLAFNEITDYVALPAGAHNVQVFPASANGGGTPVIAADVTLEAGKDYTVAAVGLLANIEPLVLQDNNTEPAAGKASLRFVHASPDAPAVDIFAQGAGVVVPNASFKQASGYLELNAASYNLEVRAAGSTTVALDLPNVTLEAGKTYTAFATGLLEGTPVLGAKLSVDATTVASDSQAAAELPAGGGAPSSSGSAITWLIVLGAAIALAGMGGLTIAARRAS